MKDIKKEFKQKSDIFLIFINLRASRGDFSPTLNFRPDSYRDSERIKV